MSILKVDTINEKTSGNGVAIPGHVVAVHNARSTVASQAINSASLVNITGLSITITPKNANNLIIMDSTIPTTNTYVTNYAFLKDGATTVTDLTTTNGINNVQLIQYMPEVLQTEVAQVMQVSLQHFETAGDTNSRTYTVACCSKWSSSSYNMYVNNRNTGDMPGFSTFRLMEIAQ